MGFSQITLIGTVGRDPEMTYTPNGVGVTKFSMAVSGRKKDAETVWYNIVAWRQLAETLNEHVKKGQQLFVQGELQPRNYQKKDGAQGYSLDVTVDKFTFVGPPKQAEAKKEYVDGPNDEAPF